MLINKLINFAVNHRNKLSFLISAILATAMGAPPFQADGD